jgi:hypothetical protein
VDQVVAQRAGGATARWLPGVAEVGLQLREQLVVAHRRRVRASRPVGVPAEGEASPRQADHELQRSRPERHRHVGDDLTYPPTGAQ